MNSQKLSLYAAKGKSVIRYLLAALFLFAGVMHFVHPQHFVEIVPSFLPQPLLLVWISGVFEILGGIGLCIPQIRRLAAYGLIALLIAVFPANINMAINNINFNGTLPTFALWLRLPLQFVLIACVWWSTLKK
jgi:uncharacterized membrane protein